MDANGDGLVTQGEAKNALNRNAADGTALDLTVRGSFDGTEKGVANPVAEVVLPRRGRTVRSRVLRLKTQTTQYADGRDAAWASGLTLHEGFPMSETMEMTAVIRFRWDGYVTKTDGTALSSEATLLTYGHNANGIRCSIKRQNGADVLFLYNWPWTFAVYINDNGWQIEAGKWYDLALTATKSRVTVHLFPEGHRNYASVKQVSRTGTVFAGDAFGVGESAFGVGMAMAHKKGNDLYYPKESWASSDLDNFQNGFNGDIHQVAVWNRVLCASEIEEAFMGGEAADCQIGVANGSNAEFAAEAGDAADVWTANDGWFRFRGKLTAAGESVTWRLANSEPRAHARMMQVALCAPTQSGILTLSVNGQAVAAKDFAGAGSLVFDIPSEAVRPGEANDFALTLTDGGPAAIDAITVGGGFSIRMTGSDANNAGHLLDEDFRNFTGYLTSRAEHSFRQRLVYRFSLPRAFVGHRMRWTVTRKNDHGSLAGGYEVLVNDQVVRTSSDLMPLEWSFVAPANAFQEGLNTLVIRNLTTDAGDGGYYSLSTLTGEPLPNRGFVFVVR